MSSLWQCSISKLVGIGNPSSLCCRVQNSLIVITTIAIHCHWLHQLLGSKLFSSFASCVASNSKITSPYFQEYEKFLHFIDEEAQRQKIRALENEVIKKMGERHDYQAYYYRPMMNKYLRINKKTGDEMYERIGDDYKD